MHDARDDTERQDGEAPASPTPDGLDDVIECPACGGPITRTDVVCPHCGEALAGG